MHNQPLVSVLMTAYNRQDYIAEAIKSVLASTFTDFELIIVDDGSQDNTVSIAKAFSEQDSRVRLYINESNLGDYPNRNQAARHAKGVYLKYLDSDDYFLPGGLEYCVKMMQANPEAEWGMFYNLDIENHGFMTSAESIRFHFFTRPFLLIGPGGTILKRDFFFEMGLFPTNYGPASDLYFNLQAASKGKLLLLKHDFFYYRIHEGQERNNKYLYLINLYKHLNDAVEQLELNLSSRQKKFILKKNKRRFLANILEYIFLTGNLKKTRQAIREVNYTFSDFIRAIFQS